MKNIDLSIVIVNYQSWDYLDNCLKSFQDYPPLMSYEIIVVDNDSQDGRYNSFKQSHPEILLIKNKGNFGFSHGCNLGASEAKGENILFLNPDTEITEDKPIDAMLIYLNTHPDVGIVSCRNTSPNGGTGKEDRFLSPWLLFGFTRFIYKSFYKNKLEVQYPKNSSIQFPDWVTGSVVLINSKLFRQIGRWNDERYWMYSEDPDLCYKVNRLGKKVALLTNVTISHIGGGASRPNLQSLIRYKTEDTISKHNYIQENAQGFSKPIIHLLYFFKIQSSIIDILLSLILLRKNKLKTKVQVLINCWKYYLRAVFRRTWKNPRLDHVKPLSYQ
ncbi:MAG: glycosyltransferase family 2 protein [Cocleimonas sp.]